MRNPDRFNVTLGTALSLALLLAHAPAAIAQNVHTLPLFMAADAVQQGFVRIINDSASAGTVTIHAIDDEGERFGPVELSLDALQSSHFNSGDLEKGNSEKGLSAGVGDGSGNWRLELETDLDIQALAYIRTPQGFLTSVHDVVEGASMRWRVHFFNPASNLAKKSLLRMINASGIETEVEIDGRDDLGASGESTVRFTLPADGARMLSAQELEGGYSATESEFEFEGSFGDGTRKWQLFVSAGRPIQVMSLMLSSDGLLSNLSTVTRDGIIRGGPQADELWGGNGDDVIDPGDNSDGFDLVHGSSGDDRIVYTGSGPDAYQKLEYSDLEAGVTTMIDGAANRATVDKGAAGTDTIVDIANPLRAGGSAPPHNGFRPDERYLRYLRTDLIYTHGFPPYNGGFELEGTPFNDVFNLSLDEGQWMSVGGNDGADTFNVDSVWGQVRIDYESAAAGVVVDLSAGRADNDGFGDVDSINGKVWGVSGSMFSDEIRGSDDDEIFSGRAGNDNIDGGGGVDWLHFEERSRYGGSTEVQNVKVDLGEGTATGTWDGVAFSYTISSIEAVIGGAGDDTLLGGPGWDILDGGSGNDILNPGSNDNGWDIVIGSVGDDTIVYSDSDDRTYNQVHYFRMNTNGIRAVVDGRANRATIDKGSAGTDTIVDVANSLYWGVGVHGTRFDDIFDLRLDDGDWMQVSGNAGNDRIIVRSGGYVRLSYRFVPGGVRVDLGEGTVSDDGFGSFDTIRGLVREVHGSEFDDVILGSDNDESFICGGGQDFIDGGGGGDRLRFDRTGVGNLFVTIESGEGTATGTWNGRAFSCEFSSIEHVRGGSGHDIFVHSGGFALLDGGAGSNMFFLEDEGHRRIVDFDKNGDDTIVLDFDDEGISHADVIAAARQEAEGVLIDLSSYGLGTILLEDHHIDDFGRWDFRI